MVSFSDNSSIEAARKFCFSTPKSDCFSPPHHILATTVSPVSITSCLTYCNRFPVGLLCLALIPLTAVARVILSTPDIGCVTLLLKTAIASIPRTNTLCTICPPSYSLSLPSILSLSTPALVSLAFSALEPVHIVHGSLCLECTSSWLSLTHALTFLRPCSEVTFSVKPSVSTLF